MADTATEINVTYHPNSTVLPTNGDGSEEDFASSDIAIVGMSCKLPGGIETPDQLWRVLASNECVIESFPKTRRAWPSEADYPGIDRGGFVKDADAFDAAFFHISPAEARITDPQQRILLELAWTCLEDAGILPAALKGSNAGVFVGASNCDYSRLVQEAGIEVEAHHGVGTSLAIIANRLSYFFDISGPSLVIDTACSSSLVALHSAVQSLRSGECSAALVGGVNLICHPDLSIAYHKAGMLAPDGQCKVFDARADGYVRSEGAVVLLLKPLRAAIAERNQIHAVIRGSAVNHGAWRSPRATSVRAASSSAGGLTVPNPQKQKELLIAAWKTAGIAAQDLSYIEAHGTGTSVGDPIEIQGIQAAYAELGSTGATASCVIGSVKSNLGHLESAAGIAGLLKILLAFQHRQLPGSVNFAHLNPKIHLQNTPFVIHDQLRNWDAEQPRLAAVSSFGSGGANAHVVVQEYPADASSSRPKNEFLFVLSAAKDDRLRVSAGRVIEWLETETSGFDFADAIFTWQAGRTAMKHRLAIKVRDRDDLLNKLKQWVAGNGNAADFWSGQGLQSDSSNNRVWETKSGRHLLDQASLDGDLELLGALWTSGTEIDWRKCYENVSAGERRPRTISLPTYPFARERYWIDTAAGKRNPAGERMLPGGPVAAVLHPLLHSNTSDLTQQSYSVTFSGDEFFLADHQVRAENGSIQKVLPEAAYLEMARAAIEHALPAQSESLALELRNVIVAQPIVVAERTPVAIAVLATDSDEIDFEIYSLGADAIVHCQGRAVWRAQSMPAPLDLDQIKRRMEKGERDPKGVYEAYARIGLVYGPAFQAISAIAQGSNELLAQLRLPKTVEDTAGDYVLHPSLIDGALQAAAGLLDSPFHHGNQARMPFALESLRVLSRFGAEPVAWVRYAAGSQAGDYVVKLDIDLCDERGNISIQMRGLSWQQGPAAIAEPVPETAAAWQASTAALADIAGTASVRRELVFVVSAKAVQKPVGRKKLAVISLTSPGTPLLITKDTSEDTTQRPSRERTAITLSNTTPGVATNETSAGPSVRLYDEGHGIFSISIAAPVNGDTPGKDVISQLLQALERVQQEVSVKVLLLAGIERSFAKDGREDYNDAVEQGLYRALLSFPYPVIAVLQGDTIGAGFMAAALCDFMVCSEDAIYRYTDAQTGWYPTIPETMLFGERFGEIRSQDFLYISTTATGKQLRERGWTGPILPAAQVAVYAERLAAALSTKPQEALRLLKQHLTRRLVGLVNALARVEQGVQATEHRSDTLPMTVVPQSAEIHLDTSIEHVLVVKFEDVGAEELVADLRRILTDIQQCTYYKAIVLHGAGAEFLPAAGDAILEDIVLEFQRLITESAIPFVAALAGNARGNAWLISEFCDASVFGETGIYSSAGIGQSDALTQLAAVTFAHRFGDNAGREFLLTSADYSGTDLQHRVGTVIVAERGQVLTAAVKLAESWTKLPLATLAFWKRHTATTLREKIYRLSVVSEQKGEIADLLPAAPASIPLRSNVVTATKHNGGIVVVKMEDREAKNMFSDAFVEGVREAFAQIERTPDCKVVILTGYDSYFSSGGTKENLLAIQAGKVKFTDLQIFQLPLDCKLPVIAAMQGHGIGAGLTLGLFADFVLLSEESQYVSPYMNYGFTPGAGATLILAEKMGQELARESLLTAQPFLGSELRERGLRLPILPRTEIYPAAMALAKQIAKTSRRRLMSLKEQLTAYVHEPLEETYRLELAMHEKTFVGHADTLAIIQNRFHQESAALPVATQRAEAQAANSSVDGEALPAVTACLKTLLAEGLQMRESDIDEHVQFVDMGLDSISGVTWMRKINQKYQTSIEATKIYSYPTLAQLSGYVRGEAEKRGTLSGPEPMPAVPPSRPSTQSTIVTKLAVKSLTSWRGRKQSRFSGAPASHRSQPIAVIGMAGQFPQANNLEEFWRNIAQGRNCITQVPANRWDISTYYHPGAALAGKSNSRWAGALEEYDLFDPLFFNISPREAESMDPQQRLFLQACWHTIENAGYDARSLSGSNCGVFVGCSYSDYHLLSRDQQVSSLGFTGDSTSILAARISYYLNLQGPCLSIDTACSSSLVALAQACDSLASGGSDLALAGGVYVMVGPEMHIKTSQAGMLSAEGTCFTFDQRADGFVPGEGAGAVLLKRLADAEKDRDIIYGVINGWGVNQDGKTNGITAPSPDSQTRLEQNVYDKYGIDPANIQLIEAHGTGTKLGDPIEVEGLKTAFRKYTQNKDYCALGSVKSNVGHCLWAAGIAGVIKVLLALKHKQLPPTINFERLNEHIDLTESPFYINRNLQEWKVEGAATRQAAVSSFGFSGTNAHMVIGEYLPPAEVRPRVTFVTQNLKIIVPLSAKKPEQLRQKARDLLEFIRKETPSLDLLELAYTLQVGREAMDERAGFLVSSVGQLAEKLEAYLQGEPDLADFYQGQIKRSKESMSVISQDDDIENTIIDKWIAARKLSQLLALWVKGLDLDWNRLYGEEKPQRIPLPAYPFAKEHYWIDTANGGQVSANSAATAVLHPLLHSNISDLSEQRYRSAFTGDEFFFADHRVRMEDGTVQDVLPDVAYLEMARAAIEHAWPARDESTVLELHNTVWAGPSVVTQNRDVSIVLLANDNGGIDYEIYSQDGERQVVHCQGRALRSRRQAAPALDLEQLKAEMRQGRVEPDSVYAAFTEMGLVYGPAFQGVTGIQQGIGQLLAYLRLPKSLEQASGDYMLHPSWMDSALQAAAGLIDGGPDHLKLPRQPFGLELLRILSPGARKMIAWARYAQGSQRDDDVVKLDIDLCDERGNAFVQMRGVSWRHAPISVLEQVNDAVAAPATRRKINFVPGAYQQSSDSSSVSLFDRGNGIFSIQIAAPAGSGMPSTNGIAHLLEALEHVQQEAEVKVLMLSGLERGFLRGGREGYNEAVDGKLYQAIVSFPYPIIAILQGDAIGAPFLGAALCDFMVCNEDATYGYTDAQSNLYPTVPETMLFGERFGEARAQDFLYIATAATGKQLRERGWTFPMVSGELVEANAEQLASTLATKSRTALRLLKEHLILPLAVLANSLTRVTEASDPAHQTGTAAAEIVSPSTEIRLDMSAEGVLVITFADAAEKMRLKELVADLGHIFAEVRQGDSCRAIVLVGACGDFLSGMTQAIPEDVVHDFQRLVFESEIPVVAVLGETAGGNAWLIGQYCDACVYSRTGMYSSAGVARRPAAALFTHRFGNDAGKEILLTGASYSGAELQRRVGTLIVAEAEHLRSAALRVAEFWARLPGATLGAWKKHTAASLQEKIRSLPAEWEQQEETPNLLPLAPTTIPLRSQVVTATAHPEGIVVVTMADREAKNMFSDAFIEGVSEAFAYIEKTPAYKVVILTGYDSYFASGATKECLMAIQEGRAKFTDFMIFQAALACKLPVIAAMQGHGIGAGWAMGMLADVALLSEESRYVSPHMNYGFTPDAGATWILADKIGLDLARESMLTAQHYAGSELKERGLLLPVMPRSAVGPAAMALARKIAQGSRETLMSLKQLLSQYLRKPLEETYRLEVVMHEKTLVGQADTLARIHKNFYQETEPSPSSARDAGEPVKPVVDSDALPAVSASLKTLLAIELRMRESDIDEDDLFADLGLDSINAVTWVRKINEKYQTSLEAARVYSYPTLAQLSRYVREEAEKRGTLPNHDEMPAVARQKTFVTKPAAETLTSWRGRTVSRFVASVSVPSSTAQPIAIIGMAGQFPQAKNLEEFWQNIAEGRNCISQVSSDRWDVNTYYQAGDVVAGKTNSRWFGALEEYDCFDPLFFNISPTEAESMDPQQRLFLQACWHSIENAGYDARSLSGSRCGVFVGCAFSDYHLLSRSQQVSALGFTGDSTSILAARISYSLNLQGPCLSIDTACSSSLVAVAQACDSLISGGSDLALAGGVYVMGGREMHIRTAQAGMLSPEGKCFTFDQRADGFVPGEAVGVVMLKRLADAERDRDIIYGVINGWGINQDGKTNGITAPNPESQTRLERGIYDKYQIDPAGIQLIEAHGTGTKLGDPIEVEGLKSSFKNYTQKRDYCALGSVKSNIGHCSMAAGIAGVIKVVLALRNKQLPPTINFERLNEHIDLSDSPFYVNTRLREWTPENAEKRQAAVSAFGFSGTNAHMVIGEYLPPADVRLPRAIVTTPRIIVPLSARRQEQLQQKARDLLDFLHSSPSVDLVELAYTLQVGREAMEERLGFLVSSVEQLTERLEAYVDGKSEIKDFRGGEVKRSKESISIISQDDEMRETMVAKWIAAGKLSKLLDLWVKGLELDWSKLYGEVKPQRIALPIYPFAKERYWIDTAADRQTAAGEGAMAVLHPLLHRNTSDLNGQRYTSTFTGDEFFLADHQVKTDGDTGRKVLPGVAYLEMARAAIEQAWPARRESTVVELLNTIWMQPIVVSGNTEISIALEANDLDEIHYEIYSQDADQEILHCQGVAIFSSPPAQAKLDLDRLKTAMTQDKVEPESVYAACTRMGLVYGSSFQAITSIDQGRGELLAQLRLPASVEDKSGNYVLHPSLMDGALQACIGLLDGWSGGSTQPRLPFALESLRVISPTTSAMVAWVRYAPGTEAEDRVVKLDIDLCDVHGQVCVNMRGLAARALEGALGESTTARAAGIETFPENEREVPVGLVTLTPVWQIVQPEQGEIRPRAGERVVVIGGDHEQHRGLWQLCAGAEALKIDERAMVEEISEVLRGERRIDHVVWILPAAKVRVRESEGFIEEQQEGVLLGFRLIKALLQEGYGVDELACTVITNGTQTIAGKSAQTVDAAHSSVHGLVGSMAKEYPKWKVRLVDLGDGVWPWEELLRLGWDARGDAWAFREGQWYRRQLAECALGKTERESCVYTPRGVYVVIGGAGGVGEVLSEYLIRNYDARVVWIGRREQDEAIEQKLDRLSESGGERPLYIAADARNRKELERACQEIKNRYGRINGVLHSAIVLADQSLANMPEEQFRAGLSAKVDVAVRLAQVFGGEALDFILYFSSVQSFIKAPGQSNYAAGCTFTDAFAEWQSANADYAVKSMNWGYWGSVGVVAGPEYEERMTQAGLGSIEPEEGMQALEQLLVSSLAQAALVKITKAEAMAKLRPGERMHLIVREAPPVLESLEELKAVETPEELVSERTRSEAFDGLLGKLLLAQLRSLGAFAGKGMKLSVPERNANWVEESLRTLAEQGSITRTGEGWTVPEKTAIELETVWEEWESWKQEAEEGGESARMKLVETTLRALPEILRGQRLATEVLFPNSSMELVEGIYKDNAIADYFNETLAGFVAGYVRERVRQDPGAKLRILEIGAGTGASSAAIFKKLAGWEEWIEEYRYTDISKAFLLHAEQRYGNQLGYLKFGLFDVEQPLPGQAIEEGSYDVVVACNVLHATRNIRQTVRHSKAALKRHGILLLNEITAKSLFAHLTFGLTEGWWKFEDAELRLAGCPALSPDGWRNVLQAEGFAPVLFPARQAGALGQQIVAAESDGVILTTGMRSASRPLAARTSHIAEKPIKLAARKIARSGSVQSANNRPRSSAISGQMIERHVRSLIRESIAHALKIEESRIQDDRSFSEYGVDSIIAVNLVNRISQQCGVTLPVTIVFDHNNVEQLMKYLTQEHRVAVLAMLEGEASSSADKQEAVEETTARVRPGPNRSSRRRLHREEQRVPAGAGDVVGATREGIYRRVVVERPGSIRDVKWVESAVLPLREHEVRIAVRAFSLNFGDLLCVKGLYPNMPAFPFTPGFDVSGIVVGIGAGVRGVEVGASVIALPGEAMGGQATLVTCSEGQVFPKPDGLSFEEACSLLTVGITMVDAFRKARLQPGESILIQTAAGGTGLIAVQLVQHAGAEIYATAGAAHKLEYLKTLGIRHVIDYQKTDFEEEILRMTGGLGVDVVINTLPGAALQKGLNCLSPGGRYIEIAMTALKSAKTIDLSVLSNNQTFYSVDLIRLGRQNPALIADYCRELMALVEQGVVRPTISDIVEFPRIQEAYERLENRDNIGKVVVTIPEAYRYQEPGMGEAAAGAMTLNNTGAISREPIAIIGLSGKFGKASSPDELWECLARGEDLTEEVTRWPLSEEAATFCPRGGFLQGIDRFDPLFFNISGVEATYMDPQQRLFLEEAWKALEDAGYAGTVLEGRQCGVYVGCATGDYAELFQGEVPPQAFWGNAGSVIPARIAYYLNLQGPAVAVDTACSSSLVAIHLACQGLWTGEVEMGIAGGVFLQCTAGFYRDSGGAGMLSPSGRCYTFDERADGFVPGEGVGVIVLKRLRDAIANGDHIYGVIHGSGINQDGTTNGITAPSAASQERLERQVYESFRIHPEDIQMVEAHGTGTKLGDPVEYQALTRSFRKYTEKKSYCAIGSIKTNIGHTASAAGVAGVIKALLSIQHKQIPPSLNYERGNPHIDFDGSPFYVNTELKEWTVEGESRRCAAVSSFGFSGTNAHIVIQEAPETSRLRPDRPGYLIALSARTAGQLRQQVEQLVRHVEQNDQEDCGDISYTLLLGRQHWNHRLTCIVRSAAELLVTLTRWLEKGDASQVSVFQLQENDRHEKESLKQYGSQCLEECRGMLDPVAYLERLAAIGELFGQGYVLPLQQLFTGADYRRISLPTYPFAREQYWVPLQEESAERAIGGARGQVGQLHPLLHRNTSDFLEQSYRTELSGDEFFLRDHVVQGQKILPAVAYLEMARAAVEQAWPARPDSTFLELHNTVWIQPVVVTQNKEIGIALSANDNDQIDFEIYSLDGEQELVHCQGRAVWSGLQKPGKLDLEQLEGEMTRGKVEPNSVYAACARMGLVYGASFQAITGIQQGNNQLLAQLKLPAGLGNDSRHYVLHPSLMDGALQACLGLIEGWAEGSHRPRLPFALESLRLISPCTPQMVAWVRYSSGSQAGDPVVKLDIELCDRRGNVCVQMRGFASRVLDGDMKSTHQETISTIAQSNRTEDHSAFDSAFYQQLIADVVNRNVSVDDAVALA